MLNSYIFIPNNDKGNRICIVSENLAGAIRKLFDNLKGTGACRVKIINNKVIVQTYEEVTIVEYELTESLYSNEVNSIDELEDLQYRFLLLS